MSFAFAVLTGISLIGPFTGTQSESFENSNPTVNTTCVTNRTFNNTADMCTPDHLGCVVTTAWTTTSCTQLPQSGSWFFGAARQGSLVNYTEITFDRPATRFGGMFASNTTLSGGVITFYSANDTLLATLPINLAAGCAWVWNGWSAGTQPAFKRIVIRGGSDTPVLMDNLQADLAPLSPGIDTCFPGVGSVMPCPCSNPATLGSGCDNSDFTGGARLDASGRASIYSDTLRFTTSGEKSGALSILLQASTVIPNGISFGQGVRCAGGAVKRMYTKPAGGGSITAPGLGDMAVWSRSVQLGDMIQAGMTRWYSVYYKDGTVLGGCPAARNFNTTQAQLVTWSL